MSLSFVIPPGSEVMLVRASERTPIWKQQVGRIFRVGYYSEQDGFGTIWLVNEDGDYEQSIEPRDLLLHFVVLALSEEKDLLGAGRPSLKKLTAAERKRQLALKASVMAIPQTA